MLRSKSILHTLLLTFWMTRGVPKSFPPCNLKPQLGESPLLSLTVNRVAMSLTFFPRLMKTHHRLRQGYHFCRASNTGLETRLFTIMDKMRDDGQMPTSEYARGQFEIR